MNILFGFINKNNYISIMKFIQHQDRKQTSIFPVSIDETICQDNEVRVIDLFVESLSLKDFGFDLDFIENGRPAYHPADLLKLFIYGFLNKIRSSRDLEKECLRNIEVMWLLHLLQPDHNTISNFRMVNEKAIKKVFRATVQIAKRLRLKAGGHFGALHCQLAINFIRCNTLQISTLRPLDFSLC